MVILFFWMMNVWEVVDFVGIYYDMYVVIFLVDVDLFRKLVFIMGVFRGIGMVIGICFVVVGCFKIVLVVCFFFC